MDLLFLLQNVKGCFNAPHTHYIRLKLKALCLPTSYSQMSQSIHLTPCQLSPSSHWKLHFQETKISLKYSSLHFPCSFLFINLKKKIKFAQYGPLLASSHICFKYSWMEKPHARSRNWDTTLAWPLTPSPATGPLPPLCTVLAPFSYTLHESVHILPLFQSVDIECNGIKHN